MRRCKYCGNDIEWRMSRQLSHRSEIGMWVTGIFDLYCPGAPPDGFKYKLHEPELKSDNFNDLYTKLSREA